VNGIKVLKHHRKFYQVIPIIYLL